MFFKNRKKPGQSEGHGAVPKLPAAMKPRIRRAGALMMALVLFLGAAFGSLPDGFLSALFSGLSAKADNTTTITLTAVATVEDTSRLEEAFGRTDDTLWFFEANATGQDIFCMNSGYALHSSDTYKYSAVAASRYTNSDAARAVIWYYKNNGYYSTKIDRDSSDPAPGQLSLVFTANQVRAFVQAYVWESDKEAAIEAVLVDYCDAFKGLNATAKSKYIAAISDAIINEIEDTSLTGYIYVYEKLTCGWGSSSTHQVLLGWDDDGIENPPTYKTLTLSDTVSVSGETVTLTIYKKDSTSRKTISWLDDDEDEASFTIKMDGTTISGSDVTVTHGSVSGNTFTTEDGYLTITYTGSGSSVPVSTSEYEYLYSGDASNRKSGTYASYALAYAAAQDELEDKIAAAKASLSSSSSTSHTWTATETDAPLGHGIDSTATRSTTSSGSQSVSISFYDEPLYIGVTVTKTYDEDTYGTQVKAAGLSLADAEYTIYANETVYDPTTGEKLYDKDKEITQIYTNSSGIATLSYTTKKLPAGYSYYVKETEAPEGWKIDSEKHEFTGDGTTVKSATVTSKEEPIFGCVEIYKRYEVTVGSSSQEYPEVGAVFEIYYADKDGKATGNAIATLTTGYLDASGSTDSEKYYSYNSKYWGYAEYGKTVSGGKTTYSMIYGTYVLHQVSSGTDINGDPLTKTALMPDQVFTVSESEQTVEIDYTNPENAAKIRLSKTTVTKDTQLKVFESEKENDAVFYVVDKDYLSGTYSMSDLDAMSMADRAKTVQNIRYGTRVELTKYLADYDADSGKENFSCVISLHVL